MSGGTCSTPPRVPQGWECRHERDLGRYDSVENSDAGGSYGSEINRDTGRSLGIVGGLHRNGGAGVMMKNEGESRGVGAEIFPPLILPAATTRAAAAAAVAAG